MDPDKLSGCSTKNNVLRLSSDNKNLLTAMHMHKHCQQRRKNIKENKDKIQNTKYKIRFPSHYRSDLSEPVLPCRSFTPAGCSFCMSAVTCELLLLQGLILLRGLHEFFQMCRSLSPSTFETSSATSKAQNILAY